MKYLIIISFIIVNFSSVCLAEDLTPKYIGEDNRSADKNGAKRKFAILDWTAESRAVDGESKELAFVVLSDLWPPKDQISKGSKLVGVAGILQKASNYLKRMRSGHPPTDALEPYKGIFTGLGGDSKPEDEGCNIKSDLDGDSSCGDIPKRGLTTDDTDLQTETK